MEIVNKVAQSGLLTIDLEEFYPEEPIISFDLKDYLFRGLILKEKDFREALAGINWKENYTGKILAVHCSADAIIPNWAYMLVTVYAQPYAKAIFLSDPEKALIAWYERILATFNTEQYAGQRIVIKGCSNKPVPVEAYVTLTGLLRPVVKSIMYGEPCSTVPLYKRREN